MEKDPRIIRFEENSYLLGNLTCDIPLELDGISRENLKKKVIELYGEDAFIAYGGIPKTSEFKIYIGSKSKRKEIGERLLKEGREIEAKSYLEND